MKKKLIAIFSLAFVFMVLIGFNYSKAIENNAYVTISLTKVYDGTGQGTPDGSFINTANGFYPGDDSDNDGIVSSNDYVGYRYKINISPQAARTINVNFEIPEYLSLDPKLNAGVCYSTTGVTASETNNGCQYEIEAGIAASIETDVTLTALDTKGEVVNNQVFKADLALPGSDTSILQVQAPAVTVVSAPAADLVIRTSSCDEYGSCTSSRADDMSSGSIYINAEKLNYPGYNSTKGSSSLTAWSGNLDVSSFPSNAIFSANNQTLTPNNGLIKLNNIQGNIIVGFTVSDWGLQENESKVYDVHIIPDEGAFNTASYKNNGTGYEPGQGKDKSYNTYDENGSGAKSGYYYANNDYSAVLVYMPYEPQGNIFTNSAYRPWSETQSYWQPGKMDFSQSQSTVFASQVAKSLYNIVTPGTQIKQRLTVYSQNASDNTTPIVMGNTWDLSEFVAYTAPKVYDSKGNLYTGEYELKWSTSQVDVVSQPGQSSDLSKLNWQTSQTPIKNAQSLMVIFKDLPTGSNSLAGTYYVDNFLEVNPEIDINTPFTSNDIFRTTAFYGYSETSSNIFWPWSYRPISPSVPTLDLKLSADKENLTFGNREVNYQITPSISQLFDPSKVLNGELTLSLDACFLNPQLVNNSKYEVVSLTPGSNCGKSNAQNGTMVLKPVNFIPSSVYASNTAVLPTFNITGEYSYLGIGNKPFSVNWNVKDLGDVVPVSKSINVKLNEAGKVSSILVANPSLVEVNQPLNWKLTVNAKQLDQPAAHSETVVVLPDKGNDADFKNTMEGLNENAYPTTSPQNSSFNGSYVLSSVNVDKANSMTTTIYYTNKNNPNLDPSQSDANWTTTLLPDATAIKVVQEPEDASLGVSVVNLQLQPSNNKLNDNYLMWVGPVNAGITNPPMAWPANIDVVDSSISGYVYYADAVAQDYNDNDEGIPNVELGLLDSNGNAIKDANNNNITTTTNADGSYTFENIISSNYQVKILSGVPKTIKSKFDNNKDINVQNTYTYQNQLNTNATNNSSEFNVAVGANVQNINFGFIGLDPYGNLEKDANIADCDFDTNTCQITYNINVTNEGNTKLTNVKLNDVASNDISNVKAFINKKVVDVAGYSGISAGASVKYLLMDDGSVFVSGDNEYKQLGLGNDYDNVTSVNDFIQNPYLNDIVSIKVTNKSYYNSFVAMALTQNGEVYMWGKTADYFFDKDYNIPTKVTGFPEGVKIKQIEVGTNTAFAISEEGQLYGWGDNQFGLLAKNPTDFNNQISQSPILIELDNKVKDVSVTFPNAMAITVDGKVYSWGFNNRISQGVYAKCLAAQGYPNTSLIIKPKQVTGDIENIKMRAVHYAANPDNKMNTNGYLISEANDVYSWGTVSFNYAPGYEGTSGQSEQCTPKKIDGLSNVNTLSSNISNGVDINIFVTTLDNKVYGWGGTLASLAMGEDYYSRQVTPTQITTMTNVKNIADPLSSYVDNKGNVYVWGNATTAKYSTPALVKNTWSDSNIQLTELSANNTNDGFVNRTYQLPDLEVGESISIKVTGTVSMSEDGKVVGNQAYFNASSAGGNVGNTTDPGRNDLPDFDEDKPDNFGKWTGNPACSGNANGEFGDSCDQVFNNIPGTDTPLGSISGKAWQAKSSTNVEVQNPLTNTIVTLCQGDAPTGNCFKDTLVASDGSYTFNDLIYGNYYVWFNIPGSSEGQYVSYPQQECDIDKSCANEYGVSSQLGIDNNTPDLKNVNAIVYLTVTPEIPNIVDPNKPGGPDVPEVEINGVITSDPDYVLNCGEVLDIKLPADTNAIKYTKETDGDYIIVKANVQEGYELTPNAVTEWKFKLPEPTQCIIPEIPNIIDPGKPGKPDVPEVENKGIITSKPGYKFGCYELEVKIPANTDAITYTKEIVDGYIIVKANLKDGYQWDKNAVTEWKFKLPKPDECVIPEIPNIIDPNKPGKPDVPEVDENGYIIPKPGSYDECYELDIKLPANTSAITYIKEKLDGYILVKANLKSGYQWDKDVVSEWKFKLPEVKDCTIPTSKIPQTGMYDVVITSLFLAMASLITTGYVIKKRVVK